MPWPRHRCVLSHQGVIPNRYQIGILLVCSKHRFHLLLRILPGHTEDSEALRDLVEVIAIHRPLHDSQTRGTAE